MADPTVIVVGNEKGGAGKSTLAIHIVCGLLHAGRRVAIIDLDLRQRSMAKFFANRAAWMAGNNQALPMPVEPDMGDGKALAKADVAEQQARFDAAFAELERERDPAKIAQLLATAHARLVDNPPWLWIVHDLNPRAMSRRVTGFTSAQSWFQDLTTVDLR